MLNPVMNNTKWDELRLAMDEVIPSPYWKSLATNGYNYGPDCDWLEHFREGGYDHIVHVDILIETTDQRDLVRSALRKIHVPGEETPEGFRVFGYLRDGQSADYI
ncbi:hypothetical protein K1W69_24595 [Hoeflea sp. WL0058]|uniref:Uncharacterized protein n=1 Tax=Flavimaribacter sediminis TaxID=2865987 RepID=A0AAE2ZQZ8_9HYPH|nr:DUF6678 family protein [Flavimaribacter sediminis]MBW8640394.1 hypothetical protein [Flavimaribacter sediminis]